MDMNKLNEVYGLNFSVKSFAVANPFVEQLNKVCYALGQQLQPFTLLAGETEQQYGLYDLAQFEGFVDKSKTLYDEIVEYRQEVYKSSGMCLALTEDVKKVLFIDYLMTISMCYIEIPKFITKEGVAQRTFDKFLVTRNPAVMGIWMGALANDMQIKYSSKISGRQVEFINNEIRAVKLMSSGKGNSITVPRNAFNTKEMTCIPLFMSYAFLKGIEPVLKDGILKFSYLKDNNALRELNTTLSGKILLDYYKDQGFVEHMLNGADLFQSAQANSVGISLSTKQHRGYVYLPELGSSRYDATGCRSLNFARILKVEKVAEVDRSFIDVDLSSVVANFNECADYILTKMPEELEKVYVSVTGEQFKLEEGQTETMKNMYMCTALKNWVAVRNTILSTTFQRSLHLFMIGNPQWFPLYTGRPNATVTSSANFGVSTMDDWG